MNDLPDRQLVLARQLAAEKLRQWFESDAEAIEINSSITAEQRQNIEANRHIIPELIEALSKGLGMSFICVPCTTEEDRQKIQILGSAARAPIHGEQLQEFSDSQQWLINFHQNKWFLTCYWVMATPSTRYSGYPFTLPGVRTFVARHRPWFDYQEKTYDLFSIAWGRAHFGDFDRKDHPATLFAEYAILHRQQDIEAIGTVGTASENAKIALKALADYEDWLLCDLTAQDKHPGNFDPSDSDPLSLVLHSIKSLGIKRGRASNLKKKGYPSAVSDWIKAARAWWRFVGKGKGIGLLYADEEGLLTKYGRYPRRLSPPRKRLNPP